jgi:hypothetical protein
MNNFLFWVYEKVFKDLILLFLIMINALLNYKIENVNKFKKELYNKKVIEQSEVIIKRIEDSITGNIKITYMVLDVEFLYFENIEILKNNGFRIFKIRWIEEKNNSYIWEIICWEKPDTCVETITKACAGGRKYDVIEL